MPNPLVFLSQRELDVDSGEQGKDIGLKHGHKDFEQSEDEAEGKGAHRKQLEESRSGLKEPPRGAEAEHQQKVAGDHVHEQSQGKGDGTQDENREEKKPSHGDVKWLLRFVC